MRRLAAGLLLAACAHLPADVTPAMLARVKAEGPNARHMRRLAALAPAMARAEGAAPALVVAAALLHDATKEDGAGTPFERFCTHGEQGAAHARAVLPGLGYAPAEVEVVARAIEQHMGPCGVSPATGRPRFMSAFCRRAYPAPASAEARVLFDLDMLDLMTVNGVAKVVELRQRGPEFGPEPVRASADSAWRSVQEAGETLLTASGRACGEAATAHTRAFLDQLEGPALASVEGFQAAVGAWLAAHPLPACVDPATAGR